MALVSPGLARRQEGLERSPDQQTCCLRLVQKTMAAADHRKGARPGIIWGHSPLAGLAAAGEVDGRNVQKQIDHASAGRTRRY